MTTTFKILLLICLIASTINGQVDDLWKHYKQQFGKEYLDGNVDLERKVQFTKSLEHITSHNEKFKNGTVSYDLGLNHYSDWTKTEVDNLNKPMPVMAPIRKPTRLPQNGYVVPTLRLPQSVDWRKQGYVTPVKDQKSCGNSYIFSAIGALEGQMAKATGKLVALSEQNVMDCNNANLGCFGGDVKNVYEFIQSQNGIVKEKSYPYQGMREVCHFNRNNVAARVKGLFWIKSGDEAALQSAIATQGPVSISFDDKHPSFIHYKSGIYNPPNCRKNFPGRAALIVGYGTCPKTFQEYYIVKNSMGCNFGMNGYFLLARNKNNACGVASSVTWPKV
uniref:Pept_C1 domain-containing protein n=1 Tax=Rhabditophanes sp. KR3021 TaxID=114890 RepID=A0AC35U0T7_9BILA